LECSKSRIGREAHAVASLIFGAHAETASAIFVVVVAVVVAVVVVDVDVVFVVAADRHADHLVW
jgi:hypothetical protein